MDGNLRNIATACQALGIRDVRNLDMSLTRASKPWQSVQSIAS